MGVIPKLVALIIGGYQFALAVKGLMDVRGFLQQHLPRPGDLNAAPADVQAYLIYFTTVVGVAYLALAMQTWCLVFSGEAAKVAMSFQALVNGAMLYVKQVAPIPTKTVDFFGVPIDHHMLHAVFCGLAVVGFALSGSPAGSKKKSS
eukprot:g61263.t1